MALERGSTESIQSDQTNVDYQSGPCTFDPCFETVVSVDASSFSLGAVVLQRQPAGELRPVAYISRSLTTTKQRYGMHG